MIIIKKMFWIYTLPFLFLIGCILVGFIFKVIKEVIKKEVSLEDFTKEVDVRYARCDTVYNSLEKLNNYHKCGNHLSSIPILIIIYKLK